MSTTYIYILGESETSLWGLSGRERLLRTVASLKQTHLIDNPADIPGDAPALLLRADHLYDARVIAALINLQEDIVLYHQGDMAVAIRTIGKNIPTLLQALSSANMQAFSFMKENALKDLQLGIQQNLKKKEPPYILPISAANREALEWELFAGSYKGVTDLVTKWLWPIPAFWATHLCVRWKISPNQVTLFSLLLAIFAGVAFWYGYYACGLVMGWLMTFLDTVDGKLARVTLSSSRLGDVLDHGLDIIHPPLWYVAWGVGLTTTAFPLANLELWVWLIFVGYIGGRICEGLFEFWLAPFVMFMWQRIDSFNRLITARRNPNLILMTASWLADRPDIGFLMVVGWHGLSTLFLAWRVRAAWQVRRLEGPLTSWMEAIDPIRDRRQLAVKVFTRVPLAEKNGSAITHP